jgi:hypothetical protein
MKRIESFRWWINDYVTSTVRRRCSLEARGAYLDILMLLYASPRPGYACETVNDKLRYLEPEEILADIGILHVEDIWSQLEKWGAVVRDDDGWHNPKAVEVAENEIDFRAKKAAAGRKGGRAKAKGLANLKQCSSSASSNALAEGLANAYPPDPDSDPDPDSESEPSSPPNPPSPWGGTSGTRKRTSQKHRRAALAWFGVGSLATEHRQRAEALLDRAAAWETAKAKRPHVDRQGEREAIDREWLALIEEVRG